MLSSTHEASLRVVAAVFALCARHCVVDAVLGNCAAVVIGGMHVAGGARVGTGDQSEGVSLDHMRAAAVDAYGHEEFRDERQPGRVCIGSRYGGISEVLAGGRRDL